MNDERKEFLVQMYNQMFNDINRHIMVVWQSITVLISAFAIFTLVEKQILTLDIAVTLMILLTAWQLAHLIDASYWYNRNLAIIANIERQFLVKDDLKRIHYYFGKHRPNKMIAHLGIQVALGIGVGLVVLLYHAYIRVVPGFSSPWRSFEFLRALPYIVMLASLGYLAWLRRHRNASYAEFMENSPGIDIDSSQVTYGVGHGHNA
jgi:hypothetical protein